MRPAIGRPGRPSRWPTPIRGVTPLESRWAATPRVHAAAEAGAARAAPAAVAAAAPPLAPLTHADLQRHLDASGLQARGAAPRCLSRAPARRGGIRPRRVRARACAPPGPSTACGPATRPQARLLARPPDLDGADVVKSLVFTAHAQPVLVVTGLASKARRRARRAHADGAAWPACARGCERPDS